MSGKTAIRFVFLNDFSCFKLRLKSKSERLLARSHSSSRQLIEYLDDVVCEGNVARSRVGADLVWGLRAGEGDRNPWLGEDPSQGKLSGRTGALRCELA